MKFLALLLGFLFGAGLMGLGVFCGYVGWNNPAGPDGSNPVGAAMTLACLALFIGGCLVCNDLCEKAFKDSK